MTDIQTSIINRQNTVAQYIATQPLLDLCKGDESEGGSKGAVKVVGPGGHRLGNGEGKGMEKDRTGGSGTDTDGEEKREDASRASGSSGAEWSGASAYKWT